MSQILCEKLEKTNETKNGTKRSLFCSISVIFLIYRPLEQRKHGDPLFLNLIFTYFYNKQLREI